MIFRKHQKEIMVILIGLALFSWVLADSVTSQRGGTSPTILVTLLAMIGAGVGYIWNIRDREKESAPSYGWLNGAVLGAIVGVVLVFTNQRKLDGVDTAAGRISIRELQNLRGRRQIANEFVKLAFFKRENVNEFMASFFLRQFLFGGETAQEVVATRLLEKEAEQFGITVSNAYINNYIEEISDKRLDQRGFVEICRQLGVDQVTLFGILREELRARLTFQLLNPASMYLPEQYWGDFQKFNVRHSIDATAIPVESFAAGVDAPSEGELKKLFDEFKSVFPAGANPGFRVPDKKRLAIVTASYEQFEKQVGEISEDLLKKLYEDRKETSFKADLLPDISKGKDDKSLKSLEDLKFPEPSKPAESKDDAEKASKPDAEKKTEAAPAEEKKVDEKKEETKADEKKSGSSSNDDGEETQDSNPPPKAEDKAASEKPAAVKAEAEKTTAESDKPDAKEPSKEGDAPKDGGEKPKEAPKYKPFDEVRDQLRDEVLREKTLELLKVAVDDAKAFVSDSDLKIGDEFAVLPKDDPKNTKEERAKKLKEAVKAYATEKGFSFEESGLLTAEELSTSKDLKIASAVEPRDSNAGPFQESRTVPAVAFSEGMVLNAPEKAELAQPSGDLHFVYWVSEVVAEHVPEFTEEGIKASVEKAFRMRAARTKAEERAKILAKAAEEVVATKPLSEAFGGETVTGAKDGLELTVINPLEFSWLRQSFQGLQMNPFQRQAPQIEFGFIPGIDKVNDDFMKAVSEMSVGDVKVLPNADKTSYYVVHLKGRNPSGKADDAALAGLYDRFLSEDVSRSQIYGGLAQSQAAMIRSRWMGEFMRKHGVDVNQLERF